MNTPAVQKLVDNIATTLGKMTEAGYFPLAIVGMNAATGNVMARAINPETCSPDLLRTVICRIVVGDISPESLEDT